MEDGGLKHLCTTSLLAEVPVSGYPSPPHTHTSNRRTSTQRRRLSLPQVSTSSPLQAEGSTSKGAEAERGQLSRKHGHGLGQAAGTSSQGFALMPPAPGSLL
jgi:hypothetical protein